MSEADAMNGNGRKLCGAKTRQGGKCRRVAGSGTDHVGFGNCKHHSGSTPNGTKAAAQERAQELVMTYGGPRTIDPHAALIEELQRTAGHVSWLELQVRSIDPDALVGKVGPEGWRAGETEDDPATYHHAKYEPSVWIKLYQDERDRYLSVAKACVAAGIAERQIKLAEQMGTLIATAITGVLEDLNVPIDAKAREVVRKRLTSMSGHPAAVLEPA